MSLANAITEIMVRADQLEKELSAEKTRNAKLVADLAAAHTKHHLLAQDYERLDEQLKQTRATMKMVRTSIDDVWLWVGDGHDSLPSLVAPVVMEPGTLRKLLESRVMTPAVEKKEEKIVAVQTSNPPAQSDNPDELFRRRCEEVTQRLHHYLKMREFDAPEIDLGWLDCHKPVTGAMTVGDLRVLNVHLKNLKWEVKEAADRVDANRNAICDAAGWPRPFDSKPKVEAQQVVQDFITLFHRSRSKP